MNVGWVKDQILPEGGLYYKLDLLPRGRKPQKGSCFIY